MCLFAAVIGWAAPAAAQDFAAAGQHFGTAQEAFAQGQYRRAAEEYQAAFDITRDSALLFNIGEAWQRAGERDKALTAYRAFVKEQPGAAERAEVEKRIEALSAAAAAPAPAESPPATATPAPAATPAQPPATATAEKPAPAPVEKPAAAAKPEAPTDAAKQAAPGKDSTATATAPQSTSRLRTAAWVSIAAAVALATAGAIFGLGAQNRADELMRRTTILVNNQPPVYDAGQAEQYTSLTNEGRSYNTAAIALLGVAGATAATGVVLFIVDAIGRGKGEKWKSAARPGLGLLPGQAVVSLGGSF